jgi:hypothetical protein
MAGERQAVAGAGGHELEGGRLILPVEEVERGDAVAVEIRRLFPDLDDPLGLGIGKPLEQDAVEEAEDRDVGAEAERERQNGEGREPGILGEGAQREPDIHPSGHGSLLGPLFMRPSIHPSSCIHPSDGKERPEVYPVAGRAIRLA